jgi:Family of unknown function (DUF6527)
MKVKVSHAVDQHNQPTGLTSYLLWCPGCDGAVMIDNTWSFNGNAERPTFEPSILTTGSDSQCHSFLRDGQWQFLSDSTHKLAGQTVPMIDLPDWLEQES